MLSKYERDRDKWTRPTLISLPERQGIGKLSRLRRRGRNPRKRSGNTPRSRTTRFSFFFCFVFFRKCVCIFAFFWKCVFSGNASAKAATSFPGLFSAEERGPSSPRRRKALGTRLRKQASVNNNSDLHIEVRGRFVARVLCSDQVHFHNFRPPNLKRVLSTEKNSYS